MNADRRGIKANTNTSIVNASHCGVNADISTAIVDANRRIIHTDVNTNSTYNSTTKSRTIAACRIVESHSDEEDDASLPAKFQSLSESGNEFGSKCEWSGSITVPIKSQPSRQKAEKPTATRDDQLENTLASLDAVMPHVIQNMIHLHNHTPSTIFYVDHLSEAVNIDPSVEFNTQAKIITRLGSARYAYIAISSSCP